MKIKFIFCFCFYLMALHLNAFDTGAIFKSANEFYAAKQYGKAITLYEEIVEEGVISKEVFYNLGNSYYQSKELGKAILNYERALKVDSKDKEIRFNLQIANDQVENAVNKVPGFFLYDWWSGVRSVFSSTGWSWLTLIFVWGGIIGIIFWMLGTSRQHKKRGFIYGLSLLAFSLLPFAFAYQSSKLESNSRLGVIMDRELSVLSAPDERSSEILKVYEGTKIEMLDQIDTWYKVRLMNGDQGWLKKGTFEWI